MSKANVMLEYRREDTTYSGMLWAEVEPNKGYALKLRLEGVTFAYMMTRLARELREQRECGHDVEHVELHRLELKGSVYAMAPQEIAELIHDPAAAIRSMHEPDRIVVVRDLKGEYPTPRERDLVHPRLRAGHDTLADAFGRYVYFRLRDSRIECPYDGRWREYNRLVSDGSPSAFYEGPVTEEYRTLWFTPRIVNENWARTFTETLLDVGKKKGLSRYYLPRGWNESGPWISHADLKQKYETFCKERDDAVGCGR